MSFRPSIACLDSISAAFDLNTEAAPTATEGNSVDETSGEATANGVGNHTDAGKEEIKDAVLCEGIHSASGHKADGGTKLSNVPPKEFVECNDRSHDISPGEVEYDRDRNSITVGASYMKDNTTAQISDGIMFTSESGSVATIVGAVGVECEIDDPAIGNASSNQKLSWSMGASRREGTRREDTCHSMDADVKMLGETSVTETYESLRDKKQQKHNTIDSTADDTIEHLVSHPISPRHAEKPSVMCLVTGNDPETSQFIRYPLPRNDRREFGISDLIWGKVRSHPWWPGQIVDPSFASELARKHQRKDSYLVAYFGDKTFAWRGDSQLKPFSTFFSQMEKQSSNEGFRDAVRGSLYEVSRRVQLGMVCSCVPERLYSEYKVHKFDSSGVRKGASAASVDKSECLQMFEPDIFLQYVTTLARFPTCLTDQYDVTVACAQFMAYNRMEGQLKCRVVCTESKTESSPCKISDARPISNSDFDGTLLCSLTSMKTRSRSGINLQKKRKLIQEDDRKEENSSQQVRVKRKKHPKDGVGIGKRRKRLAVSPIDLRNCKAKKRKLDISESIDVKSPLPTPQKSFIIGECISRVASKLTSLPNNHKSTGDSKKKDKIDPEYDGPFGLDSSIPLSVQQHLIDKSFSDEYMSMSKLLSQFAAIASDPLTIHDFCPIIVSFFSDFRSLGDSSSNVPLELWLDEGDLDSAEGMKPQKGMKHRRERSTQDSLRSKSEEELEATPQIKRKRGRPPKSSLTRNIENSLEGFRQPLSSKPPLEDENELKSAEVSSEGIKQLQPVKRKRGRPPKNSYEKDVKSRDDEGKRGRPINDKKSFEDDAKNRQVALPPICDNSEVFIPDYLNDSYWTDVVVQNNPPKRRRGGKKREESPSKGTDSDLKPDREPLISRSSIAVSDTQSHHVSSVNHVISSGLAGKRITYFGEKTVEESNPTALVLNFSGISSLPSEIDLVRIFSRYGPLKESDTELEQHMRRATVVFKRRADAEVAFKEVPFSRFGPALVDFCLKNSPLHSGNTHKVIEASPMGTAPVGNENFECSGSKNELFHRGFDQLEVTNAKLNETSSNSSMLDNLKQFLPSPMDICKSEIVAAEKGDFSSHKSTVQPTLKDTINDGSNGQNMYSGECQNYMNMFLDNVPNPRRDGDIDHVKLEPKEIKLSIGDGSYPISCDPERLPYQSSSVIANTFQFKSAGCHNVEILEEPSMKVDIAQVSARNGGSTQREETGCSLLHLTTTGTVIDCSNEKVMFSGDMHGIDDTSANSPRAGCDLNYEFFVDNKNELLLDTCVTVRGKDPVDICQMGDQDVKLDESHVVGSSLYDLGNMDLSSGDASNFEEIERERNTILDNSTISDGKPHAMADCVFQALGGAEEPATVELGSAEVKGQKLCKALACNGDMEDPEHSSSETNLHVTERGGAHMKNLHDSLDCDEFLFDCGKEQAAQDIRSPLSTNKENSVRDSKPDITDLRLQVEFVSFTDRKVDKFPGCQ